MSRSRKKHPFTGISACKSEKKDKQQSHRAYRRIVRQRLHVSLYSVISAWRKDRLPELVQQRFPHLPLVAIYGAVTYYLEHQAELDAFFADERTLAEKRRAEAEAAHPEFYQNLRQRFADYLSQHPDLAERLQQEPF